MHCLSQYDGELIPESGNAPPRYRDQEEGGEDGNSNQDAYAKVHRIQVEEEKPPQDQGTLSPPGAVRSATGAGDRLPCASSRNAMLIGPRAYIPAALER